MIALAQLPTSGAEAQGKPPWPDMEAAEARAQQVVKDQLERRRREESEACGSGPKLDPFDIWKGVTGPDDARRLLRRHHERIGSVEGMDDWLECQGFGTSVMTGPFPDVKNAEKKLTAGFHFREHGGRRLWSRYIPWPPSYAHVFTMYFDEGGKVIGIGVGEPSK